jgi:hypothetical protein
VPKEERWDPEQCDDNAVDEGDPITETFVLRILIEGHGGGSEYTLPRFVRTTDVSRYVRLLSVVDVDFGEAPGGFCQVAGEIKIFHHRGHRGFVIPSGGIWCCVRQNSRFLTGLSARFGMTRVSDDVVGQAK